MVVNYSEAYTFLFILAMCFLIERFREVYPADEMVSRPFIKVSLWYLLQVATARLFMAFTSLKPLLF